MDTPTSNGRKPHTDYSQEELVELYRQMLIVAYGKMKNRADALDIVQEAWLKILVKRDSLKDQAKLVQWAKAIVSNTANSAIRRKIMYDEILREHAVTIYENVRQFPIDQGLEQEVLLNSLDQLEPDTRKMFLLKYYYDWKDQEIADALGYPVGTVKARIHRGKKQLRALLHNKLEYES